MAIEQARMEQRFLELVKLNSPSREERPVVEWLKQEFQKLGLEPWEDESSKETGANCGNLIVEIPGEGPQLLFSAHLDVVAPMENVKVSYEDGVFRTDGTTILGADDKAGLVVILEAITALVEDELPHCPLKLIFTTCEEIGLLGAKALPREVAAADFGFVFDSGKPAAHIITSSPSQDEHFYRIHGKAAHAGVAPENGISAIEIAALAISKLELGRLNHATTANIGKINGGSATNIVPDEVEVAGEVRSFSEEELKDQSEKMAQAFQEAASKYGGRVEAEITRSFTGFNLTPQAEVVKRALAASKKIGSDPVLISSGGGSDANVYNTLGIPTVNLGVGMEGAHTKEETVAIADLLTAANLALVLAQGEGQ